MRKLSAVGTAILDKLVRCKKMLHMSCPVESTDLTCFLAAERA